MLGGAAEAGGVVGEIDQPGSAAGLGEHGANFGRLGLQVAESARVETVGLHRLEARPQAADLALDDLESRGRRQVAKGATDIVGEFLDRSQDILADAALAGCLDALRQITNCDFEGGEVLA